MACLWDPHKVVVMWWISSRSSISMVASSMQSSEVNILTDVYALIDLSRKFFLSFHIKMVRSLASYLPWILARDFNVSNMEEKRGGVVRLEHSSKLLRDNIDLLNLVNIKPSNGMFTWNNRK